MIFLIKCVLLREMRRITIRVFHMAKRGNVLTLIDEVDKIEVVLPFDKKSELQTLLMRFIAKKERQV